MKKNLETFLLIFGAIIFVIGIYAMIDIFLGPASPKRDYQTTIDSLYRENEKLDSIYQIEKDKKNKTRILYKRISIQSELDSLENLKDDLNSLKLSTPKLTDSIVPDSLRLILMKEFN